VTKPISIILADDCDAMRHAIRSLLANEVDIALSGEAKNYAELVKRLREIQPDVILMDVHMPDEMKLDAAWVKTRIQGSSLLAMSIWNDEDTFRAAQRYGALKLLNKANLVSVLVPAIRASVRLKRRVSA
jgi:two-component system, NarL family, nitrate/nitrite response regulator NarL